MKKFLKNRKVQLLLLITVILAGISIFGYYTYQQHHFDQIAAEKQQAAIDEMEKDSEKNGNKSKTELSKSKYVNKKNPSTKDPSTNVKSKTIDKSRVDYSGKDVEPLTLNDMEKVNAVKVVQSLGVGMIEIPSIGMKLPILEGVSQSNLSVGAGTMKANQEPGKKNFSLAGHYMTDAGLLFGGIQNVKKGDFIQITYQSEQVTYKVTRTQSISKNDGYVTFDSEGEGLLTLITCDHAVPGTNNRFMVRAELIK
ncbi:class A sortase [Enterococcus faecalis]|uniref:class A sortase n=1 Tax=Enterococcus faecalis TaxID=1351 RepID=UPI00076FB86B|nr:class A sortase [Enterococcus faecalis]